MPLPNVLAFHPEWIKDPIPDWFIVKLGDPAIRELGMIINERNKAILELEQRFIAVQMKAQQEVTAVLSKMK